MLIIKLQVYIYIYIYIHTHTHTCSFIHFLPLWAFVACCRVTFTLFTVNILHYNDQFVNAVWVNNCCFFGRIVSTAEMGRMQNRMLN